MVLCECHEGFLEISEMNIFNFKKDANLLARIEVLETRVAVLEGTLRQARNTVAVHEGMLQALILDKKANDSRDEFEKAAKKERQREYARKYYAANKEAIKAKKRDKRPVVSPNQLELPDRAVGGTS
jgi:hypothetical protein